MYYNYDTVFEAINDLYKRGYKYDFKFDGSFIECKALNLRLPPDKFHVVETYRFEGDSNPDDEEVVYAIESKKGIKGIIVDGYGVYAQYTLPG